MPAGFDEALEIWREEFGRTGFSREIALRLISVGELRIIMDAINQIIDYICGTDAAAIPEPVILTTKTFLLDTLSLIVVGANAPGVNTVLQQVTYWGGRPESTILFTGGKITAPHAALLNSMASHAFDFDDTHERSGVHAYCTVLPAILATAELRPRVSGAELLAALAMGVDITYRLGLAVKQSRGWHPTSVCGVLGAALAAGRIMRLERPALHDAVGLAYSLVSGTFQCIVDGALAKRMQPAFAARSAVECVMLAMRGVTGAKDILEGKYGFYSMYELGEYDRSPLVDGLGTHFEGQSASLKPYPSCRCNHAAVDAVLRLTKEHGISADDVKTVIVHLPKSRVGGPYRPGSSPQVSAQFSVAYNVAAALDRGKVGLAEFDEAAVLDPRLQFLADKVETIEFDDPYLFAPQQIVIHCFDGRTVSQTVRVMKGHPDNPVTPQEHLIKIKECFVRAGRTEADADRMVAVLGKLEAAADGVQEIKSCVVSGAAGALRGSAEA